MSQRYSTIAIGLHWAIAVLLIGNIFLGWNMEDGNHRPVEAIFQLHKSIGITVLFLSLARLGWRLLNPPPPLPSDMNRLEAFASHAVHLGFYGLMIGIPLAGWVLVSISKFNVATVLYGVVSWPHLPFLPQTSDASKDALHGPIEFFHSKGSWLVLILLGLHIAGALKHQFSAEEGVLKRMIPGIFGKTTGPGKSRGAVLTFGTCLALFVAIASVPMLSGLSAQNNTITADSAELEPNWVIDHDQSFIQFSGNHDGKPFTGKFKDWSADIAFDPDNLDRSRVLVRILTGSAETPQKLHTDTLKGKEWFSVSAFPEATVTVSDFHQEGRTYMAKASIGMKGLTYEVDLNFTLTESEDGRTVMTGSTVLDRKALNLGLLSDPNGDWVSLSIDINVKVVATPLE